MSTGRRLVEAAPAVFAVGTLGAVALLAVLGFGELVPVAAVAGWLFLTPLSAILGDVLLGDGERGPVARAEEAAEAAAAADRASRGDGGADEDDPLERLRARYADGEIDEAAFERRLDLLLETDDTDPETARERVRAASERSEDRTREPERDRT